MNHNHMHFHFIIPASQSTDLNTIINKPITCNNKAIGCITDDKLNSDGLHYNCLGVIWSRFFSVETSETESMEIVIDSINIK